MTRPHHPLPAALLLAAAVAVLAAAAQSKNAMRTKDGTTTVNTTSLAKKVIGRSGTTPVKIYIKGGIIDHIEALDNQETPGVFAKAEQVLARYECLTPQQALDSNVDAVSGATLSSTALIANVRAGLRYYLENGGKE